MKVEDRHLEQTNATVTLDFFFYLSIYLFINYGEDSLFERKINNSVP